MHNIHLSWLKSSRAFILTLASILILATAAWAVLHFNPWPSAIRLRIPFNKEAEDVSRALEKHVPGNVSATLNERYDANDEDALLDVFYPSDIALGEKTLTTVVWLHGGGWLSGTKEHVTNYAKIIASRGYTVVAVDYSKAPGKRYPTPLKQLNAALSYLTTNARRLHINPSRFVLAGDSSGAHITAQFANALSAPTYADAIGISFSIERSQIAGMLLLCGRFDLRRTNLNKQYEDFLDTLAWIYTGKRSAGTNPELAPLSVIQYVTSGFPKTFIAVGNADPLAPQSYAFAEALSKHGVQVDALFFPNTYTPPLPHEYQFNLDTDAGKITLERIARFLSALR